MAREVLVTDIHVYCWQIRLHLISITLFMNITLLFLMKCQGNWLKSDYNPDSPSGLISNFRNHAEHWLQSVTLLFRWLACFKQHIVPWWNTPLTHNGSSPHAWIHLCSFSIATHLRSYPATCRCGNFSHSTPPNGWIQKRKYSVSLQTEHYP